ncbi:unnamed protein product [Ceratitis capitata]|uniref:(Mediterranean fruit fly) hypothetical protein n=1 Tax=Ceratitis capitata TaxID=7213 RepID=A0A811V0U2_CERCA|nr:unnamed protein product [Ceratitis capitata]
MRGHHFIQKTYISKATTDSLLQLNTDGMGKFFFRDLKDIDASDAAMPAVVTLVVCRRTDGRTVVRTHEEKEETSQLAKQAMRHHDVARIAPFKEIIT